MRWWCLLDYLYLLCYKFIFINFITRTFPYIQFFESCFNYMYLLYNLIKINEYRGLLSILYVSFRGIWLTLVNFVHIMFSLIIHYLFSCNHLFSKNLIYYLKWIVKNYIDEEIRYMNNFKSFLQKCYYNT